jgi:predicted signal transduction protein with EAL and GGDEF domain
MSTGLYELMKTIGENGSIIKVLDSLSYDELIEVDFNSKQFRQIYHVSKKYAMPLSEGNYKEMFILMSEKLIHPDERDSFVELMNPDTIIHSLRNSEVRGLICREYRFRMVGGDWRWVELALLTGEEYGIDDNIMRMYVFDCHSRKSRELGLADNTVFSNHDRNEMTGLLKKRAFLNDVSRHIAEDKKAMCLVSIDIENFKLFNEWYGHNEGDLLMVQIGATLQEICNRTGGTAGYFGQDDFCLLVPYDMELINGLFEEITALVGTRGGNVGFLPAFGICEVEDGVATVDLVDRAFLAADVAKEGYHRRIRIFDNSMYMHTNEEYRVIAEFLQALKSGEIVFFLQPQCRTSTGRIVGAEALARWIKPDGSIIPPDTFIPVLEKHGLISDLDMYIWREVCRWQRELIDAGRTALPVSVNVSVSDILHTDLPTVFEKLTDEYRLDRKLIKIEITESSYIANTLLVSNTVRSLREKGFTVLMDDFGSGYSTLNMLKTVSVDIIKLDAQFLHIDEGNEEKSIRILESVTNMTKTIGVPIIVEGVETVEQKEFLQDLGCRYIQGYYFYRPMKTDDYEKLIDDPVRIDTSGVSFKSNQQFRLRELLDNNVYSDTMLNNILGSCALYSRTGDCVDIVRYNEQFYEAVDVPDFKDRLTDIQQFLPEADVPRLIGLLDEAEHDRLNGAKGILHFYKTDGSLTTFYMRFYYLRSDSDCKIYYGSVRNITKLSTLEKQMSLLSRFSTDTVLFFTCYPDGTSRFTVLFNGLEPEIGKSARELEDELNDENFFSAIGSENRLSVYRGLLRKIRNYEPFNERMSIKNASGDTITLNVFGNCMKDDTDMIDYLVMLRKLET